MPVVIQSPLPMSVRRLSPVPVVIVTGVENAGKTTLSEDLAAALQWDLLPEAARTDRQVIEGDADHKHLQHMLGQFNLRLSELSTTAQNGVICDTGGLVLDIWSKHVFGRGLIGAASAMDKAQLHLLCHTLPVWEPDPLRSMPKHTDRVRLESESRARLMRWEAPFCELAPLDPSARLQQAIDCIRKHCPL